MRDKVALFGKPEVLAYMRRHKLAVVGTIAADGGPQSALVGVGTTHALEVVFDTLSTTRKHANLQRDPRIAVTFSGPGEMTLQYEGVAMLVSATGHEGEAYREAYYEAWPDGRERAQWENLVYWRVAPRWARYSDYDRGPLIVEFHWDED
jgi:general stress protein 26